jgi:hypothetical protein
MGPSSRAAKLSLRYQQELSMSRIVRFHRIGGPGFGRSASIGPKRCSVPALISKRPTRPPNSVMSGRRDRGDRRGCDRAFGRRRSEHNSRIFHEQIWRLRGCRDRACPCRGQASSKPLLVRSRCDLDAIPYRLWRPDRIGPTFQRRGSHYPPRPPAASVLRQSRLRTALAGFRSQRPAPVQSGTP